MAQQVELFGALDQAQDALERILVDSVASLEMYLKDETDPAKLIFIVREITSAMAKLQDIKEKRSASVKENSTGVFEKVMAQLGNSPKLASKIEKHKQLQSLMSQIQEAQIKEEVKDEQTDCVKRRKQK